MFDVLYLGSIGVRNSPPRKGSGSRDCWGLFGSRVLGFIYGLGPRAYRAYV